MDYFKLGQAIRDNPQLLKMLQQQADASQMSLMSDQIYGTPQQTQQVPYQQGPDQTFPGEAPIQGLMNEQTTPGTGIYDQSVPIEQRYNQMNQRMLGSGLMGYIKQAMDNNKAMQTSLIGQEGLGAFGKNARDAGFVKGTPGFQDFVKMQANKKMIVDPMDKPYTVSDLDKIMYEDGSPVQPGTSPNMALQAGKKIVLKNKLSGNTGSQMAQLDTAEESLKNARSLLYNSQTGKIDHKMLAMALAQSWDPSGGLISNMVTTPESQRFAQSMETTLQNLLRIETGAAMGKDEISNIRRRFQPLPNDSDAVIEQKMAVMDYFVKNAKQLIDPTLRDKIRLKRKNNEKVSVDEVSSLIESGLAKAKAAMAKAKAKAGKAGADVHKATHPSAQPDTGVLEGTKGVPADSIKWAK